MGENIKESYKKEMHKQIQEMESKLERFRNRSHKLTTDGKIKIEERFNDFKNKKKELLDRLEKISDVTEDVWDSLKEEIDRYGESLLGIFQDIVELF